MSTAGDDLLDSLVDRLVDVVGEAHVLTSPDVVAGFVTDWTGRWTGSARAVVRPGSLDEVVAVVRACAAAGVHVLPQGGNTGLVGASVPAGGEVVLSLRRLSSVSVDPAARLLRAGAGVTLAAGQRAAADAGLHLGIDLASRDSATLGGVVATNAGGLRVVRFGTTRLQLAGVEAVLADGSVVRRMAGLAKDNVGYDLAGLLCGSEGTLAVITQVALRLVEPPVPGAVVLAGVDSAAAALAVTDGLRRDGFTIEAAEYWRAEGLALLQRHASLPQPFAESFACYVLVEVSGPGDVAESLSRLPIGDATIDDAPAARLWRYREALSEVTTAEAAERGQPGIRLDVSVPAPSLDELLEAVDRCGWDASVFGHLAEGNAHVILLGVAPEDAEAATADVLSAVLRLGGSISAEHGVGRAKAGWLAQQRGEADVAVLRAIKAALDPTGLLSPGVIFAATPRTDGARS